LSAFAAADLSDIFEYISNDSVKNAAEFIYQIERHILSLEIYPAKYPLIQENLLLGTNFRHFVFKKYRIIFRIADETVYVLRVMHGARLLTKESVINDAQ
jgi:plasmid stabilization system protein ParE